MEPRPAISVVVPVRDMAAELPACLTALTRQQCESFEIIVVDNGSTDESRAVAARFPVRLVEEHVPGAAAARNRGIQEARAPIIAFTDADCAPVRNWLRSLVMELADPSVTVVAGGLTPLAVQPNLLATYSSLIGQYDPEATLSHARFPYGPTANVAMRKEILEKVGGFDPAFMTYEGADLFYRIHRLGLLRHRIASRAMVLYRTRTDRRGFIRQNYRYGQGYGRFCHRYRDALDAEALSVGSRLDTWRKRVASGFDRIERAAVDRELKEPLKQLHFDRETAQLYGMLRWWRLGPTEPAS